MSFAKLLADLDELQSVNPGSEEELAKSDPVDTDGDGDDDDAAIEAAADEGEDAGAEADADAEGEDAGEGDDDGEGEEPFGKSFEFELENGEKVKAIDGTELVKALIGRVGALEGQLADDGAMHKALGGIFDLIKSQGETITMLKSQVDKLSNAGRGRKTVVAITEKPEGTMAKSHQPEGLKPQEFMAKALDAQKAGRISGNDAILAESYLLKGLPVPDSIVNRVLA